MQILDPKRIEGEKEITVNLTEGCFFFFSALNSEYKLNQTVKLDICLVTILNTWSVSFAFLVPPLLPQKNCKIRLFEVLFSGLFSWTFEGTDLIIG